MDENIVGEYEGRVREKPCGRIRRLRSYNDEELFNEIVSTLEQKGVTRSDFGVLLKILKRDYEITDRRRHISEGELFHLIGERVDGGFPHSFDLEETVNGISVSLDRMGILRFFRRESDGSHLYSGGTRFNVVYGLVNNANE